jgi:hypothetical protein
MRKKRKTTNPSSQMRSRVKLKYTAQQKVREIYSIYIHKLSIFSYLTATHDDEWRVEMQISTDRLNNSGEGSSYYLCAYRHHHYRCAHFAVEMSLFNFIFTRLAISQFANNPHKVVS